MATKSSLGGLEVLVTRPVQQSKVLCDLITRAGGNAIVFAGIDIVFIPAHQWSNFAMSGLDMIIFVSRNAVTSFTKSLKCAIPTHIQLVAVGEGSADSMHRHGLKVDVQPEQGAGSEGLLAMPELEHVAGKKILVVRGKGGRELLANSLIARGASIEYIETYERVLPSPSALQCQQALNCDCVVCTSVAGVENICELLKDNLDKMLAKPLVVVSDRIKHYANTLGFQRVVVTDDVSDADIMQRLIEMER